MHIAEGWWPGETKDEIAIGAVLVQNTNWLNADKALSNLRESGMLSMGALSQVSPMEIERQIRPSGTYKRKAKCLRELAMYFTSRGGIAKCSGMQTEEIKQELISIHGIGDETADAILLYALGKPVFVIDAYTKRIIDRVTGHRSGDYASLQKEAYAVSKGDQKVYMSMHAFFVELGKAHCRKVPRCVGCPVFRICRHPKES